MSDPKAELPNIWLKPLTSQGGSPSPWYPPPLCVPCWSCGSWPNCFPSLSVQNHVDLSRLGCRRALLSVFSKSCSTGRCIFDVFVREMSSAFSYPAILISLSRTPYHSFFLPHSSACGILAPQPGIEPGPSAVKVPSLNHWTAREFPVSFFLNVSKGYIMFSWLFVVWSHQWSFCKSPVFVCLFVFAFSSREGSRWAWVSVLRKLGGRHLALNVRGVLLGITFL